MNSKETDAPIIDFEAERAKRQNAVDSPEVEASRYRHPSMNADTRAELMRRMMLQRVPDSKEPAAERTEPTNSDESSE